MARWLATGAPPDRIDVVVVGAGLAGLAAAGAVQRAGRSVAVVEASDGLGGRVRTDVVDGFLLDRGFQILLAAYPEVERQLDLAALDFRPFRSGALVMLEGTAHHVGDPLRDPRSLPATVRAPVGSLADKLRVARLRFRVRRGDGADLLRGPDRSTIDHLHELGFSDRFIQRFIGPLFAGIQLDPDLATSSRMFDVIFRSLAGGDAGVPAKGMGEIPSQLAGGLEPGSVWLDTPVRAVRAGSVELDGSTVEAGHVIVATDGPAAATLLDLPDPGSRPAGCVWFAAPTSPVGERLIVLDGANSGPVRNLAVLSDVAPGYSPDERALIAAACPGDIADDLEDRVRGQLGAWYGGVDSWQTLRVDRIEHGQPDQRPPFDPKQRVSLGDGLWVCGDHRDTASIQGALYSGRRTAEAVLTPAVTDVQSRSSR